MAITLDDLAARVEELAREKVRGEQKVAALEQELVTLRATLAERSLTAPAVPPPAAPDAGRRPRALTRLGLLGAAAAAGAYVLQPAGAQAETPDSPQLIGTTQIISPNGAFKLDVTDTGIFLSGPATRIDVLSTQVAIQSAGTTTIQSAGTTKIQSGLLLLNSGNKPVARVGDQVQVSTPAGMGTGTIITGAPTVLA